MDLDDLDTIVLPVHLPGHWITVVVHVKEAIIHVEDPLHKVHDKLAKRVRTWLEWMEAQESSSGVEKEWTYRTQGRLRQTNGVDCGVFLIADSICAGEGLPMILAQSGTTRMRQ